MDVTITEHELDLLEQAADGAPRTPGADPQMVALQARGLVRPTAESWFTTDDGHRLLVAAGRKARHLAIQTWGRAARRPPSAGEGT